MPPDSNNGRLLSNRYHLQELLGKGAMGRVYLANDRLLGGVTVAVKFLSQALLNSKMRERFEQEATICALLGEKSKHIVKVRDYGIDESGGDIPYYVMELLQGESLSEVIRSQPLPLVRFLGVTWQICSGLQYAHWGIPVKGNLCPIIHRDIKPSNILVTQDEYSKELIKILDFGIAKLMQSEGDQTHSFMGTLSYCSPEQMEGKEELNNCSDIYSLGIMMFEMLTGTMPIMPENHTFGGWYKAHHDQVPKTFNAVNPNLKVPKPIEDLIMSCLEKQPENRPQSVEEIIKVVRPLEDRYGHGRSIANKIGEIIGETPIISTPPRTPPKPSNGTKPPQSGGIEEACRLAAWPPDKPKAKIVFPYILKLRNEAAPTLWVMLDRQDIKNRQSSTRYNQFLFLPAPHPMVLWITALYNPLYGVRWLPCYLDLRNPMGMQTTAMLGERGNYHILFFPIEDPKHCTNVMKSTIKPAQCQLLKDWTKNSEGFSSPPQPQSSKKVLMAEFEKLKPKILKKLEAGNTQTAGDISG
ncbi:MAG: serine/threonine protein kinase [Coleofasciculaceae cyanobacterium SM2_1_6]|nr:serine/threonine protein kinase [Coleofasciculaceae cyanobacterium SM2_1_6]